MSTNTSAHLGRGAEKPVDKLDNSLEKGEIDIEEIILMIKESSLKVTADIGNH